MVSRGWNISISPSTSSKRSVAVNVRIEGMRGRADAILVCRESVSAQGSERKFRAPILKLSPRLRQIPYQLGPGHGYRHDIPRRAVRHPSGGHRHSERQKGVSLDRLSSSCYHFFHICKSKPPLSSVQQSTTRSLTLV